MKTSNMKILTNILKRYPLSPFMLVIFVFLHAYNYAYKWILITDLFEPLVYSIICVSIVFFALKSILKSPLKSAIITSVFTLIFYYIGFLKDYVIKYTGSYLHLRYSLPIIMIVLILMYLRFRKFNLYKVVRLNYFFNILFLIYIIVDIGISSFNILFKKQIKLELVNESGNTLVSKDSTQIANKPDVYFIVLDEYASSVSLKQNYGYDNSSLDSFLTSKDFYISKQSKSNYTYTIFSLASTLNMNYFKNAVDLNFPNDFGLVWNYIYYNKVFEKFKTEGYEIKNFSFFNINEYPASSQSFSRAWALKFLFDKSLYSLINMGYLWLDKKHYTHLLENKLTEFNDEIKLKKDQPKFIYLHFLLPHHPYVFNNNGSERSVFEYTKKDENINNNYINQLIFTNKVIKYVINKIQLSDKKKIIIIEGDHGNRFYHSQNSLIKANYFSGKNDFKNLNAYYFYDKNYSQLHDSISPVNSFRVVFNQYFNKKYPLLKDSIIF
jgi:Sulfatase